MAIDLSESMGYTYRQDFTKFEYAISLAAALCYLMIHQQDPCGLIAFDDRIRQSVPPKSKRTQLGQPLLRYFRDWSQKVETNVAIA